MLRTGLCKSVQAKDILCLYSTVKQIVTNKFTSTTLHLPKDILCLYSTVKQIVRTKFASTTLHLLSNALDLTNDQVIFNKRLEGKVALITGGASGIGKATALEFLQHGAQVVIADIDTKLGPPAATELGHEARFIRCDVSIESEVAAAVETTLALHGKLDIMYNNAGIAGPAIPPGIESLDLSEFDRVMNINVRGIIAGIKHAARVMKPAGSGSILCTASISGILGGLGPHPYTVSKFAIPGIVKSVASELCQYGVRINCISPSPIPTPLVIEQISQFFRGASEEQIREIVNGFGELKGEICEEIDVARAALYLASDEAKYVTGHNLVIDGGFTCFKNLKFPSPDQHV